MFTIVLLNVHVIHFFVSVMHFFQDSLMNRKFKTTTFIENVFIYCNYVKGFSVTFDQFNTSLLNVSIHTISLKQAQTNLTDSINLNGMYISWSEIL